MSRSALVKAGIAALFFAAAPLLPACAVGPDGTEEAESTGRASIALVAQANGRVYRLSNANFRIEGPIVTTLGTSDDAGETVLSAALPTGNYMSTLEHGWVLQRDDGGTFVPVQATLLTPSTVPFTIYDGAVTPLVYQFQTDGTIITIGDGQLDISIEVTEVGGGACTPFGAGCGEGEWCVPGELIGSEPICAAGGSTPVGGACGGGEGCVSNAVCADLGGAGPTCIELCPASNFGAPCASGGSCDDIGYTEFGICT